MSLSRQEGMNHGTGMCGLALDSCMDNQSLIRGRLSFMSADAGRCSDMVVEVCVLCFDCFFLSDIGSKVFSK